MPISSISLRSSGQRWYSLSATRLLLPSTVAFGVRRKTSQTLSPPPSAVGEPSDCAAAVEAPQRKSAGNVSAPGAGNARDERHFGMVAANVATPALTRNRRRSNGLIWSSYLAITCSNFTGPNKPDSRSGESALYGL